MGGWGDKAAPTAHQVIFFSMMPNGRFNNIQHNTIQQKIVLC